MISHIDAVGTLSAEWHKIHKIRSNVFVIIAETPGVLILQFRNRLFIKMKPSVIIYLVIISVICFVAAPANAQKAEGRLFSVTLNNGLSFASNGGFLGGNVDIASSTNYMAGGSIQYAVSPEWSIEGSLQSGTFTNKFAIDPDFRNKFLTISFRGIGHLNHLLDLNWSKADIINPYITFGMGFIRSSIEAEDFDANDFGLNFMAGPGVSFFLNNWTDLFIQYDFHFPGTDLLDSFSDESGSDKYAILKAGVRINFGKGNQRHPSWPQPQYRERDEFFADKTETVSEKETEEKEEEETIPKEPEAEKTDYLGWLTDFSRFYSDMQTSSELLKSTRNRLEELRAERAAELEAEKREQRIAEQQKDEVLTENVPDGQYIQIRSIANRREAISYRLSVIGDLDGILQNPSEQVLITPFEQTFRILIGPFQNYSQARNAQTVIPGKYEGSFIITYPRQSDVSAAAVTPVSEPEPEPEPQPEPEPEPEQPVRPVMEESPAAVITENVPDGQYIQIRSIGNRGEAVDYRSAVVLELSGVIDNPEERVVITPFRQTFRILIGPFQSVTEARNVQRRTSNLYQGAFVITYPRQGG